MRKRQTPAGRAAEATGDGETGMGDGESGQAWAGGWAWNRRGGAGWRVGRWGYARLAFPVEADVGVLWGDAVGEGGELHVVAVVLAKHFVVAGPASELAAFKYEGRDSEKAFVSPIILTGSAAKH